MTGARILVLEGRGQALTRLLTLAGYTVISAHDSSEALTLARDRQPQLLLLDLSRADLDGPDLVRHLYGLSPAPIVCLGALENAEERVRLLGLGAHDHLTWPLHPDELLARVAAHLRRSVRRGGVLEVGQLRVDLEQRLVSYRELEVSLSPTEFALLVALMKGEGRVLSRQALHAAVWGEELLASSNVVEVHLSNLRLKLRQVGAPVVLRTLRGVGVSLRVPGGFG